MSAPSNSLKTLSCAPISKGRQEAYGLMELVEAYLAAGMFDNPRKNRFASAFRRLYFRSDSSERRKAVEQLACKRATPKRVATLICCDQAEIASIMLASSPILDEAELTTQILQGNMLHRRAIAQRNDLSSVLVSQLLFFGESEVARQLMPYADHLPDLSQRLCEVANRDNNGIISHRGQNEMTEQVEKSDMVPDHEDGTCQDIGLRDSQRADNQIPDPLSQNLRSGLFAVDMPKSLNINSNVPTAQLVNVWQALDDKTDNHLSTDFHYPSSHPVPLTATGLEENVSNMTGSESNRPDMDSLSAQKPNPETRIVVDEATMDDATFEDLSDEELEARFASGDFEALLEEEEKAPRRLSFSIGVNDEDNAPMPTLEPLSYGRDNGKVLMQGQDEPVAREIVAATISDIESDGQAETTANPKAASTSALKVKSTTPDILLPNIGQKLLEEQKLAEEARADKLLAKMQSHKTSSESNTKSAQITLTVRRRNQEGKEVSDTGQPHSQQTSTTLSSTAENDWESALADLAKEFEPLEIKKADLSEARVIDEEKTPEAETVADKSASQSTDTDSKIDIFAHMERLEPTSPISTEEKLIHEHAPFGFMPDMVSFEGLQLVEAEPDLPSATELLLKQRATPQTELVEPEEVHFSDNSLSSAMAFPPPTPEHNVMMQVTEQLEREKQARLNVKAKMTQDVNPVTHSVLAQKSMDPDHLDTIGGKAKSASLDKLPAFADHQLVDEETFSALKQSEQIKTESAVAEILVDMPKASPGSIKLSRPMSHRTQESLEGAQEGMAAQFFAYDSNSRMELLQAMLSSTLADQAMLNQRPNWLPDEEARSLISARFSNNRLKLVELLHELSGHRRMNLTELLQDQGGEALVVYLYHIGLDESRALSFVLHGPDAVAHDYNKVSQLLALFDQLYPAAAERIVTQLLGASGKDKGQATYQPIHSHVSESEAKRIRLRQGGENHKGMIEKDSPVFGRRQSDR